MVHQPGAGGAGVHPRGVVEDRAVPYVRRERRLLRPRGAAGGAEGDARRVPHRRTATPRRRRHGRPDRHELPGADARALALQPRRARGVRGLRPHVATALPRRALRSEGTQYFVLAPPHGGRPDLGAAPEAQRPDGTEAAQHVEGPDGQRAGRGLQQYVGPRGGARPRRAELPCAGAPGHADAGDGLSIDEVVVGSVAAVFLARHGETEWNRAGRRQGQLDAPLTPEGMAAVGQAADRLRGFSIDAVFSSPLGRAQASAKLYADALGLPGGPVEEP